MKESAKMLAMKLAKIKDPKKMEDIVRLIMLTSWQEGAKVRMYDEDDILLRVSKKTEYQCECPNCKAMLELKLGDLLEEIME